MEKPVSAQEVPSSEPVDSEDVPEIRYEESSKSKVFHCDGAIGGPTPKGFFAMSLYTERYSLPDKGIPDVDAQGNVTEHLHGNPEIVRRVQATALLTLDDAISLESWLMKRAQDLKRDK